MNCAYIEIPKERLTERLKHFDVEVGSDLQIQTWLRARPDLNAAWAEAVVAEIQAGHYRIMVEECTVREVTAPPPARRRFWRKS